MGRQSETPAALHPCARRPACQRGTGEGSGASGDDKPCVEWNRCLLVRWALLHERSRAREESFGFHPWGTYGETIMQDDWVGGLPERKFKDLPNLRPDVAEQKAILCRQICSICNRVPKNYQTMGVQAIREFKTLR